MITRRSALKLSIGASIGAGLALYQPRQHHWTGRGFGANLQATLIASKAEAQAVFTKLGAEIENLEQIFSLYRSDSQISRLNATGKLKNPAPQLVDCLRLAQSLWRESGGLFDPTIQGLWRAEGEIPQVGFEHVQIDDNQISFRNSGMSITLNGVAQGFASDYISQQLTNNGFDQHLVNMGEFCAGGGPNAWLNQGWHIGLTPQFGLHDTVDLQHQAIATSAPNAMTTPSGEGHIIHPFQQAPSWTLVSVQATKAAIADGWSTAMSLMTQQQIKALDFNRLGIKKVWLYDEKSKRRLWLV